MATLNKKRLLNISLHKALHRNVYLLGLSHPMGKDLVAIFKEGMFEKPNKTAFHQLSYYLMSIIDPKCVNSSTSWAFVDTKMEVQYRAEFVKFVNNTSKQHEGYISHIMPSWLVNAGGLKVAKLMFELSQVAIKVHLNKSGVQIDLIVANNVEDLQTTSASLMKNVAHKVTEWNTYSHNMEKIGNIYKEYIPSLADEIKVKKTMLDDIVAKIIKARNGEDAKMIEELSNVLEYPQILKEWSMHLDESICQVEQRWEKTSHNILKLSKECKTRTKEVEQRHINKHSKEFVLKLEEGDKFELPADFEKDLSTVQISVIRGIVKDGVLNFPNLISSYAIVISHCFKNFHPSILDDSLDAVLQEKVDLVQFVRQQSKALAIEVYKFHNEIKDEMDSNVKVSTNLPSISILSEVFRSFPSIPQMQSEYEYDNEEYWKEFNSKFQFSTSVFPSVSRNDNQMFHSLHDSLMNSLKCSQKKQKVSDIRISCIKDRHLKQTEASQKPAYMRNIEEAQRNMEMISGDVHNKTDLLHSNISLISCSSQKDTRRSMYTNNHIQKLFTSIKKKPNISKDMSNTDRSFHRKWGKNLFNESSEDVSILQKTQSSPNLLIDQMNTSTDSSIHLKGKHKSTERISGIKEIDYSSFLSGLGSMPDLSNSTHNSNTPDSVEKSQIVKNISNNKVADHNVFLEPSPRTPINTKKMTKNRKSVERIIDTYKKFRERTNLQNSETKKNLLKAEIADSFIECLDLGDSGKNKENDSKSEERVRLSSVPDLLSPGLDFRLQ